MILGKNGAIQKLSLFREKLNKEMKEKIKNPGIIRGYPRIINYIYFIRIIFLVSLKLSEAIL